MEGRHCIYFDDMVNGHGLWELMRRLNLNYPAEQLRGMNYWYNYYTGGSDVDPWVLAQAMEAEGLNRDFLQDYGSSAARSSDSRNARTPPPEELQIVRRLSERAANLGLLVNDKDSFLDSNPM
jgi:hypothetical protein